MYEFKRDLKRITAQLAILLLLLGLHFSDIFSKQLYRNCIKMVRGRKCGVELGKCHWLIHILNSSNSPVSCVRPITLNIHVTLYSFLSVCAHFTT